MENGCQGGRIWAMGRPDWLDSGGEGSGCRNLIHETCIEQPSSWDFTTSCCNGIRCQGSCRYDVSSIHPRRWFWLLPWPANFDWVNARFASRSGAQRSTVCGGGALVVSVSSGCRRVGPCKSQSRSERNFKVRRSDSTFAQPPMEARLGFDSPQ